MKANIIVDTGEYNAAWMGYLHDKNIRVVSQAGEVDVISAKVNPVLGEFIYDPAREAVQRQKPVFLLKGDREFESYCDYCSINEKVSSVVSLPITYGDKRIGVVTIFSARENAFHGQELSIIEEMIEDLSFGITILRTREEHKVVERNLHESERKYRTLTENINAGIFRTTADEEERFIEVNSSYFKIFGFENKNDLYRFSASHFYVDPAEHSRIRSKLFTNGEIKDEEVQCRRKDGSIIWCSITATAVVGDTGEISYIDGVVEDITEKKLAAANLRRSEEKYRVLVENTGEGIMQVDLDENVIYANPACSEIFDMPVSSIIGKNLSNFVDERTFGIIKDQTRNRLQGRKDTYEIEIIRPSGERRNVLITATPQFNENGEIVSDFGILRDITDRKRVEIELVRANRALKTLSAGNIALVRAAGEKELLDEVCGILVEVGGYEMAWTGFLNEEKEEKYLSEFMIAGNNSQIITDRQIQINTSFGSDDPIAKVVITQKPVIIKYEKEEVRDKWWSEKAINSGFKSAIFLPLINNDQLIGVLGIYSDDRNAFDDEEVALLEELSNDLAFGIIVQRNKVKHEIVAKEKEKIHEQLVQAQKMEAIGILAGGIAHDFNNILTAIQVSAEIALMETEEESTLYEDINEIQKLTNKASDFIRQLLLFSRKHPMEMKVINLNDSISSLNKMLHRIIGEDISIKTTFEQNLKPIKADVGTMEQVIMNLAVNARDAMPDGGVIEIKTENAILDSGNEDVTDGPVECVCLTVSDTGIGMDQQTIEHIFEPFFSTKGVGKGTGLGLSVVYGIIQQHNGWIDVDSEPGNGTSFKIYIPAAQDSEEKKKNNQKIKHKNRGMGKRILLIEDEEKVRESTSYGLNRSGYTVFSAASAEEAKAVFIRENGNFHLILSDVVLPDKSGLELVEELIELNPNLNILISSGYTDQKARWPEINEKGYRFLEKPYALSELIKAVEELAA